MQYLHLKNMNYRSVNWDCLGVRTSGRGKDEAGVNVVEVLMFMYRNRIKKPAKLVLKGRGRRGQE
jgi:hypothetical protein